MDFTQNPKAFLRQLPLKKMSGQQKFTAVAAIYAGGSTAAKLSTGLVRRHWRKSQLGIAYNPSFYDRAQRAGWVDPTGAKGEFRLTRAGLGNIEALVPGPSGKDVRKAGELTIFGRGATHSFDKFLRTVLAAAKTRVLLADSWVDGRIFDTVLDVIPADCPFKLIYARPQGGFKEKAERFKKQYPKYKYKRYKRLHDRFMVVDDAAYVLGPSIKDAASNSPAIVVALGPKEKGALVNFFDELWSSAR